MREAVTPENVARLDSAEERKPDTHASRFQWQAILIGFAITCISLVVLAAIGGVLIWSGVGSAWMQADGRRAPAVIGVLGVVVSVALGAWMGARRTRPNSTIRVGPIIAVVLILSVVLVAAPFVRQVADFRSVAIALDLIDAPDVGTRASEVLHELVTTQTDQPDAAESNALSTARSHAWRAAWYVVALLVAVIVSGVFGAALDKRAANSSKLSVLAGSRAASGIATLAGGIGILTMVLWSSIWPVVTALVDFDQSAGPEIGVSFSEVVRHPEVMWDETVTISARVDEVIDSHAALLGNDRILVGDRLLILSEPELQDQVLLDTISGAELGAGDVVQVTGTVQRYDLATLQATLGITLDEASLANYQSSAVLVVDAIDLDVPIASEAGDKEFGGGSSGYDFGVTIDDIVAQSDEYLGLTVTVSDEVEEGILTPHVFLIGDQKLLCISPNPRPEPFVESTAYVTGEVMLFDIAEVEQMLGIDLDDASFSSFEGQPFILVESVVLRT